MSREISAWDIDGTMRPGNLVSEGILHAISEGFLDPTLFVDPARPSMDEILHFRVATKGQSHRTFKTLTDRLSDLARESSFDWALDKLAELKTGAIEPILISHSPDFLVQAYARGLGIAAAHGSRYHMLTGRFTGHAETLDKASMLQNYTTGETHLAFAAGDSLADLPLLEEATEAVVVNPGPDLARIALQRGWTQLIIPAKESV